MKISRVRTLWIFMTLHDLFHDISEFSMIKDWAFVLTVVWNQSFHNMCFPALYCIKDALVFISTKIKACFRLVCYFFSNLLSFCLLFSESIFLFHDFPWPSLKFHDFAGLEIEIINFMTFQVFHDLYEPCFLMLMWFNLKTLNLFACLWLLLKTEVQIVFYKNLLI